MSLELCIPGLIEDGSITAEQGKAALEIYRQRTAHHEKRFTPETAAAMASEDTASALEYAAAERERQVLLQMAAQKRMFVEMEGFDNGSGKHPEAAAVALFVRDERAKYPNYEYRYKFHRAEAHASMEQILSRHSRNAVGQLRDRAGLDDLGRAAFGERVEAVTAREAAEAWNGTADLLRQKRNAAGGSTGKLENWGLPQRHVSTRVAKAGYPAWRADQLQALDRVRMIDEATGLPFDDAALDVALKNVFDTIASNGWNKRNVGEGGGIGKLANRRNEERFLIYKSYDDWKAMHEKYGTGESVFDVMMSHVDSMARDVSLMEMLGPNPAATVKWLQDGLQKRASIEPSIKVRDRAETGAKKLQGLYDEVTGANAQPENRAVAVLFSSLRAFQVASKLGSATLAASSDVANGIWTRAFNGLPVTPMLAGYLKAFKPSLAEDRAFAMRMGLTADDAADALGSSHRMSVEELTGEFFQRLAGGVMRVSGLNRITRVGRWAYGMDSISALTNESVKTFDRLDGNFARMLQRYGIEAAEWDAIRTTPLEMERGAPWLKPLSIERADLRRRVVEMILAETDQAVPTPGLRMQAGVNRAFAKGTIGGELARTSFQFKGFGVSMMVNNWQRMMSVSTIPGRLGFAVGTSALLTMFGAIVIQERNIAKGRDPDPMDGWEFWASAFLQGGAAGPYGDLVRTGKSDIGKLSDMLLGPVWSDINQIGTLAINSNWREAEGRKTNRGREAVRLVQQMSPGGSLWYLRTAYDRTVIDWLREQADPDYRGAQRRMVKRTKEAGGDFYWQPGETSPLRAPDWANALEKPPER